MAAAVVVLTCVASAPYVQFSIRLTDDPLGTSGWPYVYSYFGAALLSAALFAVDVWPSFRSASQRLVVAPVVLFGCWALLSAGWSKTPQKTPTEAMLFAMLLLFAVWFGRTLTRLEQGISLFTVTQVLTLASWMMGIVAPFSTIDSLGRWSGVFANRNTLGPIAVLAAIIAISVLLRCGVRSRWSWLVVPLLLADLFVAMKAGSDTAAIGFVAAVVAAAVSLPIVMLWRRRGWPPGMLAAGAVVSAIACWFVSFAVIAPVAEGLGKDATLSGRRTIWSYLRTQFAERRISGFGFGSFWGDTTLFDPANGKQVAYSYSSAHSTFMETVLGLGVVGGALLVIVWLQVAGGVGRVVWTEWQSPRSVAPVVMVTAFMFVENLTESMITLHSIFWVLLVSAAFIVPSPQRDASNDSVLDA